ncbi:MAG: thioredoxin [Sphingobium sp.]|nr:thioredoxin [Sphingobium sp.]
MTILNATTNDFDTLIQESSGPVLVDFWASWCGPCMSMAPTLADLAADFSGQALVVKVNVEEEPELSKKYGVSGLPTLCIFKNGVEVKRVIGTQSRMRLAMLIEEQL